MQSVEQGAKGNNRGEHFCVYRRTCHPCTTLLLFSKCSKTGVHRTATPAVRIFYASFKSVGALSRFSQGMKGSILAGGDIDVKLRLVDEIDI